MTKSYKYIKPMTRLKTGMNGIALIHACFTYPQIRFNKTFDSAREMSMCV